MLSKIGRVIVRVTFNEIHILLMWTNDSYKFLSIMQFDVYNFFQQIFRFCLYGRYDVFTKFYETLVFQQIFLNAEVSYVFSLYEREC